MGWVGGWVNGWVSCVGAVSPDCYRSACFHCSFSFAFLFTYFFLTFSMGEPQPRESVPN